MKITFIQNADDAPPGHAGRVSAERGHEIEVVHPRHGEELPDLGTVDVVVVLGGEMGAYDTAEFPFLIDQKRFLSRAVDAAVPVLGICLGSQLLADALGGSAYRAETPEVAFTTIEAQPGSDDPVVGVLSRRRSLVLHRDTWTLPPGAELVGSTEGFRQVFRYGSALGIQSHPEVSAEIVQSWFDDPGLLQLVAEARSDPEAILQSVVAADDEIAETADELFGVWLDEVEPQVADGATTRVS